MFTTMASVKVTQNPQPAARVVGRQEDVWSIVNAAAASSLKQPIVNMGQGFFGYKPPQFIVDAAIDALGTVDCNQYAATRGRPRLKNALARVYSEWFGKPINPDTEVTVTTGANEGILCAFMAFIDQGDEVIVFEPFFDQYISNIEMAGGKVVYVPLYLPKAGSRKTSSSSAWKFNMEDLAAAVTHKTKMIVVNNPHNPIGKIFSRDELIAIGELCVKNNIIILSDEVYDSLCYAPFTPIATLSSEVAHLTLTVGSAGKSFYVTGWRVGWVVGPQHLVDYVAAAHTRICYSTVSPLQEAVAVGLEKAPLIGFWDDSRRELKGKLSLFNAVWDELGLPFTNPEAGYFVLVNMKRVKFPVDYAFPEHVLCRPRDFKLCWFLIQEIGVAAIPPTEFCTDGNSYIFEDYLRFAVCKSDDVLKLAKERLMKLKEYIV